LRASDEYNFKRKRNVRRKRKKTERKKTKVRSTILSKGEEELTLKEGVVSTPRLR